MNNGNENWNNEDRNLGRGEREEVTQTTLALKPINACG